MTKRERLLKLFSGNNDSGTIPLVGWCDPWAQPGREGMDPDLAEKLGDIQWGGDRNIHFCKALDVAVFDWFAIPVTSSLSPERSVDGDEHTTVWHAPGGDLTSIVRRPPGDPEYTVKHAVETPEDLALYTKMLQAETFEVNETVWNQIRERKEAIGEEGLLLGTTPGTPLGLLIRHLAGVQNTTFLTMDDPELFEEYVQAATDNHLRQLALIADCDLDGVVNVDDTSVSTQSPPMFEEYVVEYTNVLADFLQEHNKFYIHHSCGLIKDLLPIYNQLRINGVHAYSLNPVGDCEMSDRDTLRNDIAVVVVVNTFIEHLATREEVAKKIEEVCTVAAKQKNVCFQISARQHWDMEYTAFIVNECKKWCEG